MKTADWHAATHICATIEKAEGDIEDEAADIVEKLIARAKNKRKRKKPWPYSLE